MKLPEKDVRYIDRPDVYETFADSLGKTFYDGHSIRIEFCVLRHDNPNPPKPLTAVKYPTCRLVLTPDALIDLSNMLQGIMNALQQQGHVKKGETPKGGSTPVH